MVVIVLLVIPQQFSVCVFFLLTLYSSAMSGFNRDVWDAYMKGDAPSHAWNFSYQSTINSSDSMEQDPQMGQSTSTLVITKSANKATANKATAKKANATPVNQYGNKRNQLPPLPTTALVRGGKRKGKSSRKTHKKKRPY